MTLLPLIAIDVIGVVKLGLSVRVEHSISWIGAVARKIEPVSPVDVRIVINQRFLEVACP